MKTSASILSWRFVLTLFLLGLWGQVLPAQQPVLFPATPAQEPLLPSSLDARYWATSSDSAPASAPRSRSIRLFHMPTGYASQPLGSDLDEDPPPDNNDSGPAPEADLPVVAAMWADNPFFDFQRPGDVGGYGFYRMSTQLQLLDMERTGCTVGVQAVMPAGLESDGVQDGPTVFQPNLAVSHELSEGLGVHGFVGKQLRLGSRWDHVDHDLQYGMAVHHPVPGLDAPAMGSMHLFVEALGRYRLEGDSGPDGPAAWELLPGLHWQLRDSCWLSGGVIVPLTTPRTERGLWQVTCSWQF